MSQPVRSDFLFEIGTEELPPRALRDLEQALVSGVREGLARAGLAHADIESFATPRRLALIVKRLALQQPEQNVRRRGPPVGTAFDAAGQPTRAALAFAESCGVPVDALSRIDESKGQFLYFIGTKAGQRASELLPDIVKAALTALPIPRRMRWGAGNAEFVRPVHWIVMLLGRESLATTVLDTASGDTTRGHRFHAPKPIRVTTPSMYARALRTRGFVLPGFEERRDRIRAQAIATAESLGGRAVHDDALLDEVTALVEWPVAVAGRFDERFLALPREVLVSTLQAHQRYFPVEGPSGALLPWFVTISNLESREPDKVREGNERVVRPRLADAAFFWEQDRRRPLADYVVSLDTVTFQAKLGSLGDKTRRIAALAQEIARVSGASPEITARAALLCKCDLVTSMVGEFPELQGIMGRYYALADEEPSEAAEAVQEHYLPRSAADGLPASRAGMALAIADKLDTLAGIFAIGQKPSGTKDPFGLRRAAIGVLRIAIESRLDIDLQALIESAVRNQPVQGERTAEDVYDYIIERLRAYYLDGDTGSRVTTEMFDAVLATRPRSPLDFDARLKALGTFLELPEAASLTAANKRIVNILRKAEGTIPAEIDPARLREPAEVRLYDAMQSLRTKVREAASRREYAAALGHLAQLRPAVDGFFDQVMVMDEDRALRENRLALLAQLGRSFGDIAEISRLPG